MFDEQKLADAITDLRKNAKILSGRGRKYTECIPDFDTNHFISTLQFSAVALSKLRKAVISFSSRPARKADDESDSK